MNMLYGFVYAIRFLTRLPAPAILTNNTSIHKWALCSYPAVGLIIGMILAGMIGMMQGFPPSLQALFVLSIWIVITGGLHLDGWMDAADALGSHASLDRKWEIMKDPHVGSFGVVALCLLLAWKYIFLYLTLDFAATEQDSTLFLLILLSVMIVPALARWGILWMLYLFPLRKKEGLAWQWKQSLSLSVILMAVIPTAILLIFFPLLFWLVPCLLLFVLVAASWLNKRFKGINGDLLGTLIESSELIGLLFIFVYLWFFHV